MGYSFTIGKAVIRYEITDEKHGPCIVPSVQPCEYDGDGSAIHKDDLGGDGPTRCPSYSSWYGILEACPALKGCMAGMRRWLCNQRGWQGESGGPEHWIPCRVYEDALPMIEAEAEKCSAEVAARVLWFARWSREALRLYGDYAAFATPGEWFCREGCQHNGDGLEAK